MNLLEAKAAIEEILDSIPDSELPRFDRVEFDTDGKPVVWWGGVGRHLGSATVNGKRDPMVYRHSAAREAIELEMTYRADRLLFENDDNPKGVKFHSKGRR